MAENFWATSDGTDTRETATGTYESGGGGSFELIPEKTVCLTEISGARWKGDPGESRISIEFTVIKPEGLVNRKMWKTLWVDDLSPFTLKKKSKDAAIEERDKHKDILSNIDKMCGGKLSRSGKKPDDDALAYFIDKPAMIRVMVMTPKNGDDPFNYISEIKPKGAIEATIMATPGTGGGGRAKRPDTSFADDLDDDVPFAVNDTIW